MRHFEVCLKTKQNEEKKKKSNHPEVTLNLSPETIIFRITAQLCFVVTLCYIWINGPCPYGVKVSWELKSKMWYL